MEPTVPQNKLEPGVYQGTPEFAQQQKTEEVCAPRIIRTMKSDADEAIKRQNETAVSIAIAEKKKREKELAESARSKQAPGETAPSAPKPINRFIVVIVVALVGASIGLAYVFVLPKFAAIKLPAVSIPSFGKPESTPVATAPATKQSTALVNSLVPAQSEKRFGVANRADALAGIATEMKQGTSSGSIKNLYFTEGGESASAVISANRLLSFVNVSAPDILTRSLEKQFMAGFWGEKNGGAVPFVILKVSSKETGLAGMLDWETDLPRFFDTLFGTTISSGSTKTKFRDIVVNGKDARIFETSPNSAIAYAFANQNTIVIAGSKNALDALMSLATDK